MTPFLFENGYTALKMAKAHAIELIEDIDEAIEKNEKIGNK
jgi:hypothetical protein